MLKSLLLEGHHSLVAIRDKKLIRAVIAVSPQVEIKCSLVLSQEAKVKKIMSKKERKEKKMFSSKDDEHFLLTGVNLADRRG